MCGLWIVISFRNPTAPTLIIAEECFDRGSNSLVMYAEGLAGRQEILTVPLVSEIGLWK